MPAVYRAAKRAFAALPLAACVARAALVLHGGLFRRPPEARGGTHRRKRRRLPPDAPLALGTLADLRAASKARRCRPTAGASTLACAGCRRKREELPSASFAQGLPGEGAMADSWRRASHASVHQAAGARVVVRHVFARSALRDGRVTAAHRGPQGGMDPSGLFASLIATDVMWSDPVAEPGLRTNDARGVGLVFGPDATQVCTS